MTVSTIIHKSVLVREVLEYIDPQPNGLYVDATFGSGGHTHAILQKEPMCTVIGVDWDKDSLDRYTPRITEQFGDRFIPVWGNFAQLYKLLKHIKIKQVNGILADFGTSQMQIATRPGFSLYTDAPLDMRMSAAHYKITAAQLLNTASEEKLAHIFFEFGEERYAKKIAREIVRVRSKQRFETTKQLADFIKRIVPHKRESRIHPATRVFQALRIYINQELENIRSFLKATPSLLADQGRIVCISFHSLEDRLVKQFFHEQSEAKQLKVLTKKVVVPSEDEIQANRAARSAKLRAAVKIGLDEQ